MSAGQGAELKLLSDALDRILDPRSGVGLIKSGIARGLSLGDGRVNVMLEVPAKDAGLYAPVRDAAETALASLPGVTRAQVVLTTTTPEFPAPQPRARRAAQAVHDPRADVGAMPPAQKLPHVRRAIAVASGKGGVGKSTVAVNLACALAAQGLSVGLLDGDIYGPSAPRMLGIDDKPAFEDGKLEPLEAFGVKVMSMGFIVPEDRAMIWRGPMATSALRQMLEEVRWGTQAAPLDILVVDLPPGTGDIHLTLVQKLSVDGVVIVSTPQEIALIDARRAAAMFDKVRPPVPILGVVENMAFFVAPGGERVPIFGEGGARREAERLGAPFLGEIPIEVALRESGDLGRPLVISSPETPTARVFLDMAQRLARAAE